MEFRFRLFSSVAILSVALAIGCSSENNDNNTPAPAVQDDQMLAMFHQMRDSLNAVKLYVNQGHDFGLLMKRHHNGAINMGNKELDEGDDATIKAIAKAMISRKQQELVEVQKFLDGHTPTMSETGRTFDGEAKTSLDKMYNAGDQATLNMDADHDFALLMTFHHQSVIELAQSYLRLGNNVSLRATAQKMIDDESKELKAINDWLATQKQ